MIPQNQTRHVFYQFTCIKILVKSDIRINARESHKLHF